MSLPHLLTEIGAYFQDLQIPNFCLGPPMTVEQGGYVPQISFDAKALPNCPLVLIIISFTRNGFVEGQNYILINRRRQEFERINPFPSYFGFLAPTELIDAGLAGFRFFSLRPENLPEAIRNDYFSSIYYLETRLRNPSTPREQILEILQQITPQIITNYRDRLLGFIPPPSPNQNRGIILCSGRTDLQDLPAFLPQGVDWTTLDTNINSDPDVFGSYTSFTTLRQLGLFNWDYVFVWGCLIGLSITEYQNTVRAARWLLKRGGQVYIPKYRPRASEGLSAADQRERDQFIRTQTERIREQEFFSQVRFIGRSAVFTA